MNVNAISRLTENVSTTVLVFYDCYLNIFGFWTVDRTKKTYTLVSGKLLKKCFKYFIDQMFDGLIDNKTNH